MLASGNNQDLGKPVLSVVDEVAKKVVEATPTATESMEVVDVAGTVTETAQGLGLWWIPIIVVILLLVWWFFLRTRK